MHRVIRLTAGVLLALSIGITALAQDGRADDAGSRTVVTATATSDRVRIAAPSAVVQLRLEVYDDAGQKLLDTEQRGGNVLDRHLQDGNGQRVADGTYLCVVTIKNLSGRLSQKLALTTVSAQSATLRSTAVAELSLRQAQAIGPIEGDEGLTVMPPEDAQPVTVLANNDGEAQLARTRGALSFRVGDFFSGNDKEQMRLTEEGNLGIGTAKPKVKLDVAGMIRAREGFAFSDGSRLNVNDKGALTLTNSNGTIAPNVAGTGTQNRLTRWTDSSGTLGDSFVSEAGGIGLQLTAPPSTLADTNLLFLNGTNGTAGMLAGSTPAYGANNGPFFAMRGNTFTTFPNQRGLFAISAGNVLNPVGDEGSVKFNTGNDQLRMIIKPVGNVGIGTTSPQDLFNVNGNVRWGGTTTKFAYSGEDGFGLFLEQNGSSSAESKIRLQSSKSGDLSNYSQLFIDPNNGFSFLSLGTGNGSVGIGTATPRSKLDVRGNIQLGTGGQYFATGGEENLRIVRGVVGYTGNIIVGSGFHVSIPEQGKIIVTFDSPFAAPLAVTVTPDRTIAGTTDRIAMTDGVTASTANIRLVFRDSGNNAWGTFHFIAIGPR